VDETACPFIVVSVEHEKERCEPAMLAEATPLREVLRAAFSSFLNPTDPSKGFATGL